MVGWYPLFFVALTVLWLFSIPRDRAALGIVLLATVGSALLTELVTRQIHAPWKLAIPGAVETLTILSLLRWAPGRTGYLQAILLAGAWLDHVICYVDVTTGSNLVYSRYEQILGVVAILQLCVCFDTLRRLGRGLVDWCSRIRWSGNVPLHAPSPCDPVLRNPGKEKV